MIERFYDPLEGQVLLDGEPINEFNIQEYRKQIALVSQEPVSSQDIVLSIVPNFPILYSDTLRRHHSLQHSARCHQARI